jgi:hypothetical protein
MILDAEINFVGFPSRECGVNLYRVPSTMTLGLSVAYCDINMALYRGIKPLPESNLTQVKALGYVTVA